METSNQVPHKKRFNMKSIINKIALSLVLVVSASYAHAQQTQTVCIGATSSYPKTPGSTDFRWTVTTGASNSPINNITSNTLNVTWTVAGTHEVIFWDRDDDTRSFSVDVTVVTGPAGGTVTTPNSTVCQGIARCVREAAQR
jgi:hypothetical protein